MEGIQLELIDEMASWIQEICVGQMRMGFLTCDHHKSFNSTIARLNRKFRNDGEDKWAKHWINTFQQRVAVLVMTLAEREEIKKDINKRNIHENKLPKKFRDKKEAWEVGTWHC